MTETLTLPQFDIHASLGHVSLKLSRIGMGARLIAPHQALPGYRTSDANIHVL